MTLAVGDKVGAYEILGPLGAGGMGILYRAHDPRLRRDVAIKILAQRFEQREEHVLRFEQEALAASALNHPNIVTIYDIGTHEGTPFIAMELIEGVSLRNAMTHAELSLRRLVGIAAQIARGLAAAHEKGIVHRDLKPDNVMVTPDGFAKILDFGLAKLMPFPVGEDDETAKLKVNTNPGVVMGTVGYMSPEQARGLNVDFRSDQFSFGSILYEMLTGRRAFRGGSAIDTLSAIINSEPEDVLVVNPRLPGPLGWVVKRCLKKDPADRYASTKDLAQELESVREHMTDTAGNLIPGPARRLAARRTAYAAAAVLALALAIGGSIAVLRHPPRPAQRIDPSKPLQVVVLPFRNLGGNEAGQLIGDGFAETVGARLASSAAVRVVSEGAGAESGGSVAKTLRSAGADVAVTGSLQFSGGTVRATYTVLDHSGATVSSGQAEGQISNLFALQDEIADMAIRSLNREGPRDSKQRIDPKLQQDRYLEAVGYLRHQENEASVDAAIHILESLGSSALVQSKLAQAYLYKFRISMDRAWAARAISASEAASRSDPALSEVRLTRGLTYLLENRYDEAVKELETVLDEEPSSYGAIHALARAKQEQGHLDEAERLFRRAIAIRPEYWASYDNLGAFYLIYGRLAPAIEQFKHAVSLSPDNTDVLNNLGAAYQQSGRFDDAAATYQRSISVRPNPTAFSNLGTLEFFQGRYDESARSFERATALSPGDALMWANLGDAYRWSTTSKARAGEAYGKAISMFEGDLTVRPREPTIHSVLALCYAKNARPADAASHARLAVELAPKNPYVLYQAATAFEIAGDRNTAIELLSRAAAAGYPATEIERDPELASLRKDAAYARIGKPGTTDRKARG